MSFACHEITIESHEITWTQAQEGLTSSQKQTWEKAFWVEGHRHGISMAAIFVCSLGILSGWWFETFLYCPFHRGIIPPID
jgi:hypothetical protein